MKTQKLVTCTSLYTSIGSGNLRNDIHALLNLDFIFLAILVDESWKIKHKNENFEEINCKRTNSNEERGRWITKFIFKNP